MNKYLLQGSYDAASVSFNLLSLINQSEDEFEKILNLQIPEIVPFENICLLCQSVFRI